MTTDRAGEHRWAMALSAFALVWAARCGGYERGIEVQVALRPEVPVQSILTDRGYRVSLEAISLRIASVRLVPCQSLLTHLQGMLDSTAYAHHVDVDPEQGEGSGALLLLHANGAPMPITTLRPPPGTYCYAELTLGPDGPDTLGLSMHGQAQRDGRTEDFEWTLRQSAPIAMKLEPRLQLNAEALDTLLIFDLEQSRLLDGYDFFSTLESPNLSARLRRALNLFNLETL